MEQKLRGGYVYMENPMWSTHPPLTSVRSSSTTWRPSTTPNGATMRRKATWAGQPSMGKSNGTWMGWWVRMRKGKTFPNHLEDEGFLKMNEGFLLQKYVQHMVQKLSVFAFFFFLSFWNQRLDFVNHWLEPFEVRFEVCMNAHKKSKSSGNPGPRSSNLQLWMSKPRVKTAETLTPLSINRDFYLYFEFLSNYFLAVCPFHIPLYPANPAVYPLDGLQENF